MNVIPMNSIPTAPNAEDLLSKAIHHSKQGTLNTNLANSIAYKLTRGITPLSHFKPDQLARLAQVYAKALQPNQELFDQISYLFRCTPSDYTTENISLIAHAFAVLKIKDYNLMQAINNRLCKDNLKRYKPYELTRLLCSLSKLRWDHSAGFEALVKEVQQRGGNKQIATFTPTELCLALKSVVRFYE